MKKTIGILAHVDAGKTTFAEELLYITKSIRQKGRVDHKDAFLDSHHIEKERGITVFSDEASFTYNGSQYYLVDTPGHVDFSPEMERAIQIMDYAIIIISAVEGIQGHTETVWQLLQKHKVPTFFFINKIDRVGADVVQVLEDIRVNLTADVIDINNSFRDSMLTEELIESIAERDEFLLETYMNVGYEKTLWVNKMREMITKRIVFPCCNGSALQGKGIIEFLEKLDKLTETSYKNSSQFAGRVYKIRYDENEVRITYIKALQGTTKLREFISYLDDDGKETSERITQIRRYNGNKYQLVDHVSAGELFAVVGISKAKVGTGIGGLREKIDYDLIPTLRTKVIFDSTLNIKDVLKVFRILEAEDPSLNVTWEEGLQEIHLHVMGVIQLEVLEKLVMDRFKVKISFGEPKIIYKETIENTVEGYGHFEPLGHYAEVHLKLEPGERNSGISFVNKCHADDLTIGHQNLIKHHIFERSHRGILIGGSLTDIKITLLTGRAHNKHTSGGDFREATYRGLRQGLEKANNLILEPYYYFTIKVDIDHIGRVLSDLQSFYGTFDPPNISGNKAVVTGKAPVKTIMSYSMELAAFTQGKGSINLIYAGYYPCHNEEEVIEETNYDKNKDPEYSSTSIFCSKGQGYRVEWQEVEDHLHCTKRP
ncbi:elongation factor G [Alkaliphilus transvaalensis]|uniref:elongation factor G n=1 Tax=Alkaliphilus transvaalensis TaxID=114628 RepID=UPI000478DE10|nr:TetM/TetW/TetO/TetS family tetracycline resistance ribosomal protection protein [Alkaliphilus transvaalensis]